MKKGIWIAVIGWVFSLQAEVEIKEIDAWQMQQWQQFFEGKLPDLAVYFPKGWNVPIELFFSGFFFDWIAPSCLPPYRIEVRNDFFLRMIDANTLLFSIEGQTWRPFSEFTNGSLELYLERSEDRGPIFIIEKQAEMRGFVR